MFKTYLFSEEVKKLLVSERQSLHALSYALLIIMAFFGPNAEILGNIKLSIWQFEAPIQDIQAYIYNIGVWLIVDLASLVVNGIVIWYSCKINILKVMKKMQEGHWALYALAEAYLMMEVRNWTKKCLFWFFIHFLLQLFTTLLIGAGHDLTMEFNWSDGRFVVNDTVVDI